MIKILSIIILSSVLLFSQKDEKQNPNVELPDFVITGTEKVNVEKAKKIEPELVTTISEEFIKPSYSPEELELRKFSTPLRKEINFADSVHYRKGYLDLAAGFYNIPSGKLFYSAPFSGGLFSTSLDAFNRRAYVKGSDRYDIHGEMEGKFFSNSDAPFLPGSEYRINGGGNVSSYKLYGSPVNPEQQRTVNEGSGTFSFSNYQSKFFQSFLEVTDQYTSAPKDEFKENNFSASAFQKLVLENFVLSGEAEYKNNSLNTSALQGIKNSYFSLFPRIGLDVNELFKVEFGFSYSNGLSSYYFTPYVSLGLKLDRNLVLYGEFFPHAEFQNASYFLKENPYMYLKTAQDLYTKYNTDVSAGVKYEFDKYFQINGGISIQASDNYPYYGLSNVSGTANYQYAVYTTRAKIMKGYLDLLYHLGPFGYLYGRGEFNIARDSASFSIPYISPLKANAAYGFSYSQLKLDTEIRFTYAAEAYTDLTNTLKLPSYIDLGLKFAYQYKPDFNITLEFANILQHDNYRWALYKEQPFNLSAGIHLIF